MMWALIAGIFALVAAIWYLAFTKPAPLNASGYTYPGTPGA